MERVMGIDNPAGSRIGRAQYARQGAYHGWFATAHVQSTTRVRFRYSPCIYLDQSCL